MQTVLVIEDELALARLAHDYLERAGYRAVTAPDLQMGRARLETDNPDLVVLDLGLPDGNGLDLLRDLRKRATLPVIILTARGEEVDRIVGLELGADDYMVKPFSPNELVARVRAVLRRGALGPETQQRLDVADLSIDIPRMRVTREGAAIDLTATEFQLLATMAREPGRVFTRGQLLNAVHGVMIEAYERAIDAHIKNIRRKLESSGAREHYIQTVHGVGYRFNDAP
jgi:two-component system alkaline phosphatase synthesis response regulator PhoP